MRSANCGVSFQGGSLLRGRKTLEERGVGSKRQLISSVRSGLTAEVNFQFDGRSKRSGGIGLNAEDILDGRGPSTSYL